jgi:hypothetical protein
MNPRHPKAMLQFIVRARQALDVVALKQSCSEVVGEVAKVLKRTGKLPQRSDLVPHLSKESHIPFPDTLTWVLLGVGQDHFRLMHEAVCML